MAPPGTIAAIPLLLTAALPSGCSGPGAGGADRREIIGSVQTLFDAIGARDPDLAGSVLIPEGALVAVWREEDGSRTVRPMNHSEWAASLARGESTLYEAFTEDPLVVVEGDVAVVWGEYRFEIDDRLSHTGIDAITLVRTDDGWKIAGGAFTRVRPDE